jgi:hypothetical protein
MGRIFNRRNAVLGWVAWIVAKRQLRKKAKEAVPFAEEESRRGRLASLGLGILTAVGIVYLWRKLRGGGGEDEPPAPEPPPASAEPTPITSVRDDDVPPAA